MAFEVYQRLAAAVVRNLSRLLSVVGEVVDI